MKKLFTLFILTSLLTDLGGTQAEFGAPPIDTSIIAGLGYTGPREESAMSDVNCIVTLGFFAHAMSVGAVADVIGVEPETSEYPHGFLTVRVVNTIYGCTNGQELVLVKEETAYNPDYYPTNNSQIVFAGIAMGSNFKWGVSAPPKWKLPAEPEIIHSPTNAPVGFS